MQGEPGHNGKDGQKGERVGNFVFPSIQKTTACIQLSETSVTQIEPSVEPSVPSVPASA